MMLLLSRMWSEFIVSRSGGSYCLSMDCLCFCIIWYWGIFGGCFGCGNSIFIVMGMTYFDLSIPAILFIELFDDLGCECVNFPMWYTLGIAIP